MDNLSEEELAVWSGYFCTLVGWGEHPGYYRDNAAKPTLKDCAKKADEMIIIRRQRQGVQNENTK